MFAIVNYLRVMATYLNEGPKDPQQFAICQKMILARDYKFLNF